MKVIGVSGMPGSGKGVVSQIAQRMGIQIIRMGDVIRDEAKKRNEDVGKTAISLRKEYGDYVVAEKCVEKIKAETAEAKNKQNINDKSSTIPGENKKKIFMIEGIRSPYEIEIFKKNFNEFVLISVFSNPKTRFRRLKRRKRSDDSGEFLEFEKRDQRELGFGIGDVIATSDYLIVNEGPLWRFKNQVKRIVRKQIDRNIDKKR